MASEEDFSKQLDRGDPQPALVMDSQEKERRWKVFREKRKEKSVLISKAKATKKRKLTEAERATHSKVPLELLAREWLNEQNASNETRSYMVEKLLPTLVIGLEKLLDEVSIRGLEDSRLPQEDFNPVNFIAQYLMRNNPRYSNFAEAHPYCRTMRQVSEELKKIAYAIDENRLAELRSITKLRREERDRHEAMKVAEEKRRRGLIKDAYLQWMLQSEEGISVAEVKLAFKSWLDMVSEHYLLATTLPDLFTRLLTNEEGLMVEEQFMTDVMSMTGELPSSLFDSLAHHLSICGVERKNCRLKELRRDLFSNVFSVCDPDQTGMVDRQRVLHLLSLFYDSNSPEAQSKLQNPKKWPIVEVIEDEELGDEEDDAITSTTTTLLSEEEYQEFLAEESSSVAGKGGIEGETGKVAEFPESEMTGEGDQKQQVEDAEVTGEGDQKQQVAEEEPLDSEQVGTKSNIDEEKERVEALEGREKEGDTKPPSKGTEKGEDVKEGEKQGDGKPQSEKTGDQDSEGRETKTETSQDLPTKADSDNQQDKAGSEVEGGAEEKSAAEEIANIKQREGEASEKPDRPPASSALVRKLTSYGNNRATSVSKQRRLSGMSSTHPTGPTGPGHMWDHVMLNCPQFVQLVELFLGVDPEDVVVDAVSSFIRINYTETAQERADRLEIAQQQALQQSRHSRVSTLFEVWDNDHSGYLELEELQLVLSKWQGFNSQQALEQAEEVLSSLGALHRRLTRTQFGVYIDQLTENMDLSEFEEFADYLMASVELSFEEQRRSDLRRKLLAQIQMAGKTGGLKFVRAMRAAVAAIHQDAEEFGGDKEITVGVAILEPSSKTPNALSLHFKAASSSVESAVVGKKLSQRFRRGVSFQAVDANRPVYVENIHKHGGVHYFIPEHHKEDYKGALIVSPICTPRAKVVGVVNVDSLSSYQSDSPLSFTFNTHEINFYQGVGVCLGEVFHWIDARQKLLLVAESALTWIHRRCPLVTRAAVYIVEPGKDQFTLRCMLTTSAKEEASQQNQLLKQGENLFRNYLFQCSGNSESVSADVYGEHHLAYPIRDHTGCAVAVVDFYMPPMQSLNRSQMRELTRVLKLLTLSFYQLSVVPEQRLAEDSDRLGSTQSLLGREGSEVDATVLFDQLLLADLQETMAKLDNRVFAEMRSYIDPPELVLKIIQALLYILQPEGDFDTWKQCKQSITLPLVKAMQSYDPLKLTSHSKLAHIKQLVETVSADSVKTQGSQPTKLIYSWVNICTSLLERGLSVNTNKPVNSSPKASSPELHKSKTSAVSDHNPVQSAPGSATTSDGGEGANRETKSEDNASAEVTI